MRKVASHSNRWKRYEVEKKALAARNLTPAAYEKALRELSKRLKL